MACGICGESAHNRRTCPSKYEEMKDVIENNFDEDQSDGEAAAEALVVVNQEQNIMTLLCFLLPTHKNSCSLFSLEDRRPCFKSPFL